MMEDLQLVSNTIASSLLLITSITYLIFQCAKKPPEEPPKLKEPTYPQPYQSPPKPGIVPTEDQYYFYHSPIKRKSDYMPTQAEIAEMIAAQEAAKDPEIRRKWGEEYCRLNPPQPLNAHQLAAEEINKFMAEVRERDRLKAEERPKAGPEGRRRGATPSVQGNADDGKKE